MSGDVCRWRGMCGAPAVGKVAIPLDVDGADDELVLAVGRYCAEHLVLFEDIPPDSTRAAFEVVYDRRS